MAAEKQLEQVLRLCIRERTHFEVPPDMRWAVRIEGDWGAGYPTFEDAAEAILERAAKQGGEPTLGEPSKAERRQAERFLRYDGYDA